MNFSILIIVAIQAVTMATPAAFKNAILGANEATHMTAAQILFKKRTEALSRKYALMLESNRGFGLAFKPVEKPHKKETGVARKARIVKRNASNNPTTKHGHNGFRSNRFRSFQRFHQN